MMLVAHFLPMPQKADLFRDVASRLRPGAPLTFADLAIEAAPDSEKAAVRRRLAMAEGWSASDADAMVRYMADTLYPVDGTDLDRLLAETGFGPARSFFHAPGYRAWLTRRATGGSSPLHAARLRSQAITIIVPITRTKE